MYGTNINNTQIMNEEYKLILKKKFKILRYEIQSTNWQRVLVMVKTWVTYFCICNEINCIFTLILLKGVLRRYIFIFTEVKMKDQNSKETIDNVEIKAYMKKLGFVDKKLETNNEMEKVKSSKVPKKIKRKKSIKIKNPTEEKNIEKINKIKTKQKRKIMIQDNEISSTVSDVESNILTDETLQNSLLIKPGSKWFEYKFYSESAKSTTEEMKDTNIDLLKSFATNLFHKDITIYRQGKSMKRDYSWIRTVLKNGTIADKVSAHTLLIQDSAVHNLSSIDSLILMVNAKGKKECLIAVDTLKDLFLYDLLLEEKKLQKFEQVTFTINSYL
ncbi:CCAAT/enhancer-binding protein zeta-like [Centruroides sculpturatus]|uniref:CCAAT/enhancer-binding protein zeta-like n=1 Tax=Centruroides sculpturatus TaxID=218467 RepID=UPI000C6DA6E5|nr:CCAAT/enhancer-binding protein zeta-like [Centruroides sculpturatus]